MMKLVHKEHRHLKTENNLGRFLVSFGVAKDGIEANYILVFFIINKKE